MGRHRGPTALTKSRGTGFEEYFADPPMTPDEAREEKNEIYNPNFPFDERIQACIQRFRSRRRLAGTLTAFFNTYLFLGGVDSTPGAYNSIDPKALKEMTPAERREATANDIVHGVATGDARFYDGNMEKWEVDFAGVAAGFFSTLQAKSLEASEMMEPIALVENFLRYVLHHDVCPEFTKDVDQALQICDLARKEWPMIERIQNSMPGRFNMAVSKASGAFQDGDWGYSNPEQNTKLDLLAALALAEETDLFAKFFETPAITKEAECSLEVCSIIRPGDNLKDNFKRLAIDGKRVSLPPIGKAIFKPTTIEGPVYDLPRPFPFDREDISIFLDDNILRDLKVGMKMTAVICELAGGFYFLKKLCDMYPSFYIFLPQELMLHFKEPCDQPRPAPSAKKPEVEGDATGENDEKRQPDGTMCSTEMNADH